MKTEILKLKNFEGYYYSCACCGEEIMHPYYIKGIEGVYGSSCVKKIAGIKTEKQLKIIISESFKKAEQQMLFELSKTKEMHEWCVAKQMQNENKDFKMMAFFTMGVENCKKEVDEKEKELRKKYNCE